VPSSRPNPRLAKTHRSYTVEEVATLFGVHRNTVRAWVKAGLQTVDNRRPTLVLGSHLSSFLRERRERDKRPCRLDQIYCMRCRAPSTPAGRMVIYQPLTPSTGNLIGRCPDCGTRMFRRLNLSKFDFKAADLHLSSPQVREHIGDSNEPSANCDSHQLAQDHAKAQP
jgi:hypothetical protein